MDARGFLEGLAALDQETADCLVGTRQLPAREPTLEPFPPDLPEILTSRLGLLGIEGLYPHQSRGLEALRGGRDVILSTGTASGKTLVYD
ncbi:MAG: ATP-dependent helicase, partial [Actinomycetota bacterium]